MGKNLVIVFVKNRVLGKVKTRLAKTIGDTTTLEIYSELLKLTEIAVQNTDADVHVYYSEHIESDSWEGSSRFIQSGNDLGDRMLKAFQNGFEQGYENIVLIGSDLPDITHTIIEEALDSLTHKSIVFGPAKDGGYYLIGLKNQKKYLFENKPWSTSKLLDVTLQEILQRKDSVALLTPLNDIDTYEDLIASDFYKENPKIQALIATLDTQH